LTENEGIRQHHAGDRRARLVTIGLVAGVFSGLFAIGGGFLIVPAIMLGSSMPILNWRPHKAKCRVNVTQDCQKPRLRGTCKLRGKSSMRRTLVAVISCGVLLTPTFVNAEVQPEKAAVKQATATCRAEVKDRAKYNEMSLWARHKAVKKCVADTLAKH
jgi:hypothetical protein